jgi:hypothetical protein
VTSQPPTTAPTTRPPTSPPPVTTAPTTAPTSPPPTSPPPESPTSPPVTTAPITDPPPSTGPPEPTATTTPPLSPSPTPPGAGTIPNRSGLPWASGVFIPGDNPAAVEAFATWRARPVDVATTWSPRQTWQDIESPTALYQAWASTPYTLILGVAPIPEADASATLTGCANHDYDQHWTTFATTIKNAGLAGRTIIRLGWEFNGDWYKWQATDPAAFVACWQNIHTSADAVAPELRWDWNVNRGPSQALPDPTAAYPGDTYVDYIGVDSYDDYPGATNDATWQQQYSGPYGLQYWADFATAHGKQLSIPEWGVYPGPATQGHNGGDNPYYISQMEAFFRSLGPRLGYESYFNESAGYYAGSLFAPTQNPNAAIQYLHELTVAREPDPNPTESTQPPDD